MGCWGVGIFDEDYTLDIRDIYNELIYKGYNDQEITEKILELFKESAEDEDEGILVYSALAAIQLSRSMLLENVKAKTISLIENHSGMDRWKENGKLSYKLKLKELNKLKMILCKTQAYAAEQSLDNKIMTQEYTEPLQYIVYTMNRIGKVVYVGSTAFPNKRFKYMNYIQFNNTFIKSFSKLIFSLKTKEEKFWQWFSENEIQIYEAKDINDIYIKNLYKQIKRMHPDLTLEISSEIDGKKILVISADGISDIFPNVIKLTNELKHLTKWIVVPFRQRLKCVDDLRIKVDGIEKSVHDFKFISEKADDKWDLNIYVKDVEVIDNSIINFAYLLLDSIIGEYDVETRIGLIEVKPLSSLNEYTNTKDLIMLPGVLEL